MKYLYFASLSLSLALVFTSALANASKDSEKNKAMVRDFYDLAFNKHKPTEAAKKYIGDHYIQHNPHVPNGAEAFYTYFEDFFKTHPQSHVVFSHIVADGDLVVLHLNSKNDDQDLGSAVVDIFRIEKG